MRSPLEVLEPDPVPPSPVSLLRPGTPVDVRCRFDRSWAHGFSVDEVLPEGVYLRRMTDDARLPIPFDPQDVRVALD
jgi:hypothetical protein